MCRISSDSDLSYKASELNVGEIHQTLPMQPEQQQDVVPAGSQKLDDQSVCNMERTGDLHDSTDGSITQNSNGLRIDGVVGAITWAVLLGTRQKLGETEANKLKAQSLSVFGQMLMVRSIVLGMYLHPNAAQAPSQVSNAIATAYALTYVVPLLLEKISLGPLNQLNIPFLKYAPFICVGMFWNSIMNTLIPRGAGNVPVTGFKFLKSLIKKPLLVLSRRIRNTAYRYIREQCYRQQARTISVAALSEPAKSWDQECIGLNHISVSPGIVQHPKVDLLNDRNWKLKALPNNSDHSPKFRKLDLVKSNKSQLEDKLVLLCAQVVERLVNRTIRDEAIGDILELHQGMKLRKKPIAKRLSMTLWRFISLVEGSLRMSVAGWFESFVHPTQDDENSGGHRFNAGLFACLAVLGMTTWIVGATNNLTLKDYGIEAPLLHQVKSVR